MKKVKTPKYTGAIFAMFLILAGGCITIFFLLHNRKDSSVSIWQLAGYILIGLIVVGILLYFSGEKKNFPNLKGKVPGFNKDSSWKFVFWIIGIALGLIILSYAIPWIRNYFSSKEKQSGTAQAVQTDTVSSDTTTVYELKLGSTTFVPGAMYHYYRDDVAWHDITTTPAYADAVLTYQKGHFRAGKFISDGTSWKQPFTADGSVGKHYDKIGPNKGGNYYITVTKPIAVEVKGLLVK